MHSRLPDQRIAILLSTFNGALYLGEQLDSLLAQTHTNWVLYWRDDGSSDDSRALITEFAGRAGQGRCVEMPGQSGNVGPAASFYGLLRAVTAELANGDAVAFADQDDVWLANKLKRGLTALASVPDTEPALYCARQVLVDAQLRRIGLSAQSGPTGGFPAALTQNVATGCTIMLNRLAARLVADSTPSPSALHDWWCYLVVMGAGGRLLQDPEPTILYRQHANNAVGAPHSTLYRAIGALRRGPEAFMEVLRHNIAALAAQPNLLTAEARRDVATLDAALRGGLLRRLRALRIAGLERQTWLETMVFRAWFILG